LIQPGKKHKVIEPQLTESILQRFDQLRFAQGSSSTADIRDEMQRVMQKHAAVFRNGDLLQQGVEKMQTVFARFADIKVSDRSLKWNTDLMECLELGNMLYLAQTIVNGALNRTESRGGHAREDFPERDDLDWLKHTLCYVEEQGQVSFAYRPVHLFTLTDECELIPPKKRVY